jgi:type IV pilus assembly protein PilM
VFRLRGDRLQLENFAVESLPAMAGQEDGWLDCTRAALAALRARADAPGPVVVVLPAHLVLTKFFRTPRLAADQRAKIVRFEAGQYLPYALTDVVWESVVVDERALAFGELLAAAKLDVVEPLCAAVQAAGFEPRLILPAPLATLAAFRLLHPAEAGSSLVLNLGARSTTLLLAGPGRFGLRTLALGGNSLAPQIAGNQDCDPGEAGATKLASPRASLTADAMENFATRLTQEITRSVLHFRRQGDLEQPGRVHLTGGGAGFAGFDQALAARLQLPVGRLDPLEALAFATNAVRDDATAHASTLTDLVGAAATQLRSDQPTLNLLPPRLRRHADFRRRQPWLIAAAVLAVAALLSPGMHYRRVSDEARRKIDAIEHELAPLRERDARNRANLRQLDEVSRQVARLQEVHDRRASWLNLLADLQDRLVRVEDVWLERLSVTPVADGGPLRLQVAGRMLDRTNPLSKVSLETTTRVKALLHDIAGMPQVSVAETGQRFDHSQPGILKFDFVLVANPAQPL